ncbi:restriction endonuclease [Desulfofundulus thermocisternus]|jgi:hypothetical protein|uniref:restriction endonuclease n=1 Tax=Desulfofundulus thermocisternus TaxID=42471 RepID=UPI0004849649|nr:restriction endonuclease [Desulfofundulus thermocisternus]
MKIKFPRQVLYLAYRTWQKRRQQGEFLRYYLKPKEDSRNKIARWLDFYITIITLGLLSFAFFTVLWPAQTAFFISLFFMIAAIPGAAKIHKKRLQKENLHRKLRSIVEGYRKKLKQLEDAEELASFIWPFLNKLPQFEQAQPPKGRKKEKFKLPGGVIRAIYRNIPVLINFIPSADKPVDVSAVHELLGIMKKQGYRYALLVTPGEFAPDTMRLVASLRNQYRIALVPEKELLYLLAQAEKLTQPADRTETTEVTPFVLSLKALIKAVIDYKKGRLYLVTGALLTIFYFILGPGNSVSKVYLFLAAANLFLALLCLVFGQRETVPPDIHDLLQET